jgi:antitoxin component of MazEF toxin-antitoxin module
MTKIQSNYLRGKTTNVLVIPREIAQKYHVDNPSEVTIEGTSEGLLIKKVVASDGTTSDAENAGLQSKNQFAQGFDAS